MPEIKSYEMDPQGMEILRDPQRLREALDGGQMLYEVLGYNIEILMEFYEVASRLCEERRYDNALDVMVFVTRISPEIPAFWASRGYICEQLLDYHAAQLAYQMAMMRDPFHIDYFYSGIRCALEHKEYGHAKAFAEVAFNIAEDMKSPAMAAELRRNAETLLRDIDLAKQGGTQ